MRRNALIVPLAALLIVSLVAPPLVAAPTASSPPIVPQGCGINLRASFSHSNANYAKVWIFFETVGNTPFEVGNGIDPDQNSRVRARSGAWVRFPYWSGPYEEKTIQGIRFRYQEILNPRASKTRVSGTFAEGYQLREGCARDRQYQFHIWAIDRQGNAVTARWLHVPSSSSQWTRDTTLDLGNLGRLF